MTQEFADYLYKGSVLTVEPTEENGLTENKMDLAYVSETGPNKNWILYKDNGTSPRAKNAGMLFIDATGKTSDEVVALIIEAVSTVQKIDVKTK